MVFWSLVFPLLSGNASVSQKVYKIALYLVSMLCIGVLLCASGAIHSKEDRERKEHCWHWHVVFTLVSCVVVQTIARARVCFPSKSAKRKICFVVSPLTAFRLLHFC